MFLFDRARNFKLSVISSFREAESKHDSSKQKEKKMVGGGGDNLAIWEYHDGYLSKAIVTYENFEKRNSS